MPFIPHTAEDEASMLAVLGLQHRQQLFDEIPATLQASTLNLPSGLTEMQVVRLMEQRAGTAHQQRCFMGFGAYDHHIPAAVWDLVSRGELMTAYTPYQAEASQGTLQIIYEFQSMMAQLVGMEVCNASVYDGGSGLAEAALMALRLQKKQGSRRILVPEGVHPWYRQTLQTIVSRQGVELVSVRHTTEGRIDQEHLQELVQQGAAALVIAQPNYWGVLEQVDSLCDQATTQDIKVIALVNPLAMAWLKPPGSWGAAGADLVVGEAQPLGIPLASGGPYLGFMACRMSSVRQLPGRLVGRTVDLEGKPGYTLTLQAREQHIRRAKATSNICTNQGLAMAAATIYLSLLGGEGLAQVAQVAHARMQQLTHLLAEGCALPMVFNAPVFHERVFRLPVPVPEVLKRMSTRGFAAGVDVSGFAPTLGNALLVCTTEKLEPLDLQDYARHLGAVIEELRS